MFKSAKKFRFTALILVITICISLFIPAYASVQPNSSPAYGITSGSTYMLKNKMSHQYLTLPRYTDDAVNIFQKQATVNDQYSRAIIFSYISGSGNYTLKPLLYSYFGDTYVSYDETGNVCISNNSGNEGWSITYISEEGGYVLKNSSGKALTSVNNSSGSITNDTITSSGNIIVSDYTGADSQIWILESVTVNPHMIKNDYTIEKKNIGKGAEWVFQLGSSQMNSQTITGYEVSFNESLVEVVQNGNYLVVKINEYDNTSADYRDNFAIIDVKVQTLYSTETRTVIVQDSGQVGGTNSCRTIPISSWNVTHGEIIIDEGQPVKHLVTFKSNVGPVNIEKWELVDNLGSVVFATHNEKELVGSSYAVIEAKKTGFAVIRAYTDDGKDYSQVIEVNNRRSDGTFEANNYVKDIDTSNLSDNNFELQLFKNYMFKSDVALKQWNINFDEELGYYAGNLISMGEDYVVLSYETNRTVVVTANSISGGSSLELTINPAKGAIIILPGAMGSQIFAGEDIIINSDGEEVTLAEGTKLWDPSTDISQLNLLAPKVYALAMDALGNSRYQVEINSPLINQFNRSDIEYGAKDIYRNLYNALYNKYRSYGYDIILYEYDWRKNPNNTAQELDAFITASEYDDVILVGHSLGGVVASYYISQGETERSKVNKNISIGSPYLGSAKLLEAYFTGDIVELTWPYDSIAENYGFKEAVVDIIYNVPSIYSLAPYSQHWDDYLSYTVLNNNLTLCTSYSETMNALSSYMPKWNTYLANVNTFYQNNLFLENGNYITELVDSYYIVGEGVDTINSLQFNVDINDEFTSLTVNTTNEGDGTVTIQSATVGNTLSADRVYYKLNSGSFESDHVEMAQGKDDTTTIEFVCDIIDLSPTQMQYPENHENWYDWFGVYREGEIEENI